MKQTFVVTTAIAFMLALTSCSPSIPNKVSAAKPEPVVVPAGLQAFFPIRVRKWFGIIDDKGNVVVPTNYNEVSQASLDCDDGQQHYFLGQKNVLLFSSSHWLYVSDQGAQEFAPQLPVAPMAINRLDSLFTLFESDALRRPYDKFGWIPIMTFDPTGRWKPPAGYEPRSSVFENRVFVVSSTSPTDGSEKKAGLADRDGNIIVHPRFVDFRPFSEGRAAVKVDGKWGFIDLDGNLVIPPKYNGITWFDQGKAMVYEAGRERMYFIDSMGKELHEFPLDWKMNPCPMYGFSNGLRFMERPTSRSGDRRYGYVAPTGDWLDNVDLYDTVGTYDRRDGASIVYRRDTISYCILTRDGQYRGNLPSGAWLNFRYGLASDQDAKIGYVDFEGNFVWRP